MLLVAAFNPITATSGTFNATTLQTGCSMLVHNKTYVDVSFKIGNGDTFLVLANDRRKFIFNATNAQPNPTITWQQQNIDYPQTVIQLENICYVEIYQPGEIPDETYPVGIQRETLPNLIPYNVGHVSFSFQDTNPASGSHILWPTSYLGFSTAPKLNVGGLGCDYVWPYQNLSQAAMVSLPGIYNAQTGKTANDATPQDATKMSYIPGPFSLAGLRPVDTATYLNGTYWTLASSIAFNQPTGFWVDGWFNAPQGGGGYILASNNIISISGVAIYLDPTNGHLRFSIGNGTNFFQATSSTTYIDGTWHYFQALYTGTTVNTILLFVDGMQIGTTVATTGAISNTANIPRIGSSPTGVSTFTGAICNLCVNLGHTPTTGDQSSAAARFEHGQQSLNTDYQNSWVTGIDVTVTSTTPLSGEFFATWANIFNPGGLMFASTPASTDPFHIYNLNAKSLVYGFPDLTANTTSTIQKTFPQPITNYNTAFLGVTGSLSAGTTFPTNVIYTIHGYNLLGMN